MNQATQTSKREDMALTSERVRIFMSDSKVARSMTAAIRRAKRGHKGTFAVSAEMQKRVDK